MTAAETITAVGSTAAAVNASDSAPANRLAEAQYQIGVEHELDGRLDAAADCYRAVLDVNPAHAEAHANLGGLLRQQGELLAAEEHLARATSLDGQLFRAHHNLAQVRHDLGDLDKAMAGYRQALGVAPDAYESLVNLGTVLTEAGEFTEAVATFRRAIAREPQRAEAYNNLGQCWQAQGRFDDALCQFDAALERAPDDAETHLNRAFLRLQYGDFSRGWREYEWRWRKHRRSASLELPPPLWQGQPLAGRSILVHAEQGLGDEIMFLTCLPDLVSETDDCTVVCDQRLAPLVARSFPTVRVIACRRGGEDWNALAQMSFDFHTPAGALPRYLRPQISCFAPRQALFVPHPAQREVFRRRLTELGPGKKIGLAWRGGVKQPAEIRQRSVPCQLLKVLTQTPGAQFVVLQHDARPEELETLRCGRSNVHTLAGLDLRNDLEGVAAVLSELDLAISAAGAVVHLAGAVGAPAWLLLPQHWGWRWLTGRENSVWYASLRVFRQSGFNDWPGLLQTVRAELSALCR